MSGPALVAPALTQMVRRFVEEIERRREPDMSFRDDRRLPPLPGCAEGPGLSRYLLLAAAIDAGVGSAGIRPFLSSLDRRATAAGLGRGLFDIGFAEASIVEETIAAEQRRRGLLGYRIKRQVPRILAEANGFVDQEAGGDFDAWSEQFDNPAAIVSELATKIWYQGKPRTETRKKMWMLMRWLVRPAPDLGRWKHLDPSHLMVPVDGHVARFATQIGVLPRPSKDGPFWADVVTITDFARELFPGDPACVDYPFFMWGRMSSLERRGLGHDPDTCVAVFRRERQQCPLSESVPCSASCPGSR